MTASVRLRIADQGSLAFIGFRLRHLQDAYRRDGQAPQDGLRDLLERQRDFLEQLWSEDIRASYEIRLRRVSDEQAHVRALLLGRIAARDDKLSAATTSFERRLRAAARVALLDLDELPSKELQLEIAQTDYEHIIELRRAEGVVPLESGDIYVCPPAAPVATTLESLLEALTEADPGTVVSIGIYPTRLTDEERQRISLAANQAHRLASRRGPDFSFGQGTDLSERAAPAIAAAYEHYLRRLVRPFAVRMSIAGTPHDAPRMADALRAALVRAAEDRSSDAVRSEPSYEWFSAGPREISVAADNLRLLSGARWAPTVAPAELARLPYLFDAASAASFFHFPIAREQGVRGHAIAQLPPFRPFVPSRAAVARRLLNLGTDERTGGAVNMSVDALTRHALIAGATGSGKTTFLMKLLLDLWRDHRIPFLVIEPTKSEFRSLLAARGLEDLRVFTVGDESVAPLRWNPLELVPGVTVEAHISRVLGAFAAAFAMFQPLPMLFEESLREIYRRHGWRAEDKVAPEDPRGFPTLAELSLSLSRVIERAGYSGEPQANIDAASRVRINSLRMGAKGRLLDLPRGLDVAELLSRPTVLELKHVGDDEEKALVMAFVLIQLYAWVAQRPSAQLRHVTVIDEAHRLLRAQVQTSGDESPDRSRGPRRFADLLSEVRAFGEAVVLADQIPTRLIEDAVKNTSLKVMLRTPARDDREIMGASMNLTPSQVDHAARLTPGKGILWVEGLQDPIAFGFPDVRSAEGVPDYVPDEVVHARTGKSLLSLPAPGCSSCRRQCDFRDAMVPLVSHREWVRKFAEAGSGVRDVPQAERSIPWMSAVRVALDAAQAVAAPERTDAAWCFFTLSQPGERLSERVRKSFDETAAQLLSRPQSDLPIAIR